MSGRGGHGSRGGDRGRGGKLAVRLLVSALECADARMLYDSTLQAAVAEAVVVRGEDAEEGRPEEEGKREVEDGSRSVETDREIAMLSTRTHVATLSALMVRPTTTRRTHTEQLRVQPY